MSIKMTIGELSRPGLAMALQKLNGMQVSGTSARRFEKMIKAYNKTMGEVRTRYEQEVIATYGQLDEAGKPVQDNSVPWGFKLKEGIDQSVFEKANDDFHLIEVTVDRMPLVLSDFGDAKMSAAEFTALGALLYDPEDKGEDAAPDNVAQMRR